MKDLLKRLMKLEVATGALANGPWLWPARAETSVPRTERSTAPQTAPHSNYIGKLPAAQTR
jgi:hypothetical protein